MQKEKQFYVWKSPLYVTIATRPTFFEDEKETNWCCGPYKTMYDAKLEANAYMDHIINEARAEKRKIKKWNIQDAENI